LRFERVTARPDDYENESCAEVCGEMQSIVALEGRFASLLCVLLSRAVSLGAAALRDALRCF
jgi:hypothetical protein